MNTSLNNNNTAADLAANFNVAELEPRLENAWTNGTPDRETECPSKDEPL